MNDTIIDSIKGLTIGIGGASTIEYVHSIPITNEREALYKLIFQFIIFVSALIPLADRMINYYTNKKNKEK